MSLSTGLNFLTRGIRRHSANRSNQPHALAEFTGRRASIDAGTRSALINLQSPDADTFEVGLEALDDNIISLTPGLTEAMFKDAVTTLQDDPKKAIQFARKLQGQLTSALEKKAIGMLFDTNNDHVEFAAVILENYKLPESGIAIAKRLVESTQAADHTDCSCRLTLMMNLGPISTKEIAEIILPVIGVSNSFRTLPLYVVRDATHESVATALLGRLIGCFRTNGVTYGSDCDEYSKALASVVIREGSDVENSLLQMAQGTWRNPNRSRGLPTFLHGSLQEHAIIALGGSSSVRTQEVLREIMLTNSAPSIRRAAAESFKPEVLNGEAPAELSAA